MSKSSQELLQRMNRLAAPGPTTPAPPAAPAPAVPAAVASPAAPRRTGGGRRRRLPAGAAGTRLNVDLEPKLHRILRIWALDHGADGSEIVRLLIELLDADPRVAAAIEQRLEALRIAVRPSDTEEVGA